MLQFLKGRIESLGYAIRGVGYFFYSGPNMRIAVTAVIVTTLAGLYFDITPLEWCLVVIAFVLVIGMEAMNTAVEILVDLLHPDKHPAVGRLKDIASGAVLFASIGSAIIAGFIFGKYIVALIQ